MRLKRRCAPALLLLTLPSIFLGPSPAQGQDADADARIAAAFDRAMEAGIPTELLQNKMEEGTAKGVTLGRIANAIHARLEGLLRAQQALSGLPEVNAADLGVAADALLEGVSEAALRLVAESTPPERRTVAVAALTYLYEADIAPGIALARVQAALAGGPMALQDIPGSGGPGDQGLPPGLPPGLPTAPRGFGPPDQVPGDPPGPPEDLPVDPPGPPEDVPVAGDPPGPPEDVPADPQGPPDLPDAPDDPPGPPEDLPDDPQGPPEDLPGDPPGRPEDLPGNRRGPSDGVPGDPPGPPDVFPTGGRSGVPGGGG